MPTDSGGNYSLPPVYRATPGTTIRAEQFNAPMEDIGQGLSERLMRDGRNGMVGDLDMGAAFRIRNLAPGRTSSDALTVGQGVPLGTVVSFAGPTAPSGWMLCFGQEVSRSDYSALFAIIGTAFGAGNGSTTFNLPDARGRVEAGLDNMGGTDATRLSAFFGALARTMGGVLGAASHILTIAQSPSHNHGGSTGAAGAHNHGGNTVEAGSHAHSGVTDVAGAHNHTVGTTLSGQSGGGLATVRSDDPATGPAPTSGAGAHQHGLIINAAGSHVHGIVLDGNHAHTITAQGGGEAHPNVQPTIMLNKIIKVSI